MLRKPRRWILPETDNQSATTPFPGSEELHPLVRRILEGRGISSEQAPGFLNPSLSDLIEPLGLKGMQVAVERLEQAVVERQPLAIYGDYDVDGLTSTAILSEFFREIDVPVLNYIPNRLREGYGLNSQALDTIAAQGPRLVVTVDCGTAAVAEAEYAHSLGIELIITDHHKAGDTPPRCVAMVNPNQPGCTFPDKGLAGVGVAFYLLIALRRRLRETNAVPEERIPDLKSLLDLVALGTVADIAPLKGQNRILVSKGLKLLSEESRLGIRALKKVAGMTGQRVSAGSVGFRLGPRINAAGRLGMAEFALKLLTTRNALEASEMADLLERENRTRQQIEREMYDQASRMLRDMGDDVSGLYSLVLASDGWHQGVVGIVASKLSEELHLPVAMISLKGAIGRGSARGIQQLDLYDALSDSRELFEDFGGHKYAAGFSIKLDNVQQLRENFEQSVRSRIQPDDLMPQLKIDSEIDPQIINDQLLNELSALAPFGAGNPEPVFAAFNIKLINSKVVGGDHLKLWLDSGKGTLEAIGFNMGRLHDQLSDRVHLAFCPRFDMFGGRRKITLHLRDVKLPD
ncbi:MAG: single-stranded-DNA-specific exonuclease RecJ [Candidatus Alcyoniella australis]|nr:single-stranded-DNA-specific exonuclease RecJ [Candidatus Alcyoniella australis]